MINQACIDLVAKWEGFREEAYLCPANVWTVGYGLTSAAGIIDVRKGVRVTEPEARAHLRQVLEKFAAQIRPAITAPINENEFAAFLSLAYNIGPGAFRKSSALKHFNAGDKAKAADAILLWNKAGGRVLKGLQNRRAEERALFLTPVKASKAPKLGIGGLIAALLAGAAAWASQFFNFGG